MLSFLGLGIQPPLPSWGNMLTNAQELIWQAPLLAIYPGLLIFLTVIAFNLLGDGLQDALDPRASEPLTRGRAGAQLGLDSLASASTGVWLTRPARQMAARHFRIICASVVRRIL